MQKQKLLKMAEEWEKEYIIKVKGFEHLERVLEKLKEIRTSHPNVKFTIEVAC